MKFSIIIPVYNVAPYLRECLDSLLAQTFIDWEAICVDDGSTDGSGAILDEYAAKDARFRIIHQKNAGVSSARNIALNVARGEYIGFLDGDDAILPELLQVVFDTFKCGKHIEYANYGIRFFGRELEVPKCEPVGDVLIYEGSRRAICERAAMLVTFSGTIAGYYRRDVIGNVRFDKRLVAREDTLFHLQILPRLESVADIHYQGYLYRAGRTGNASSRHLLSHSLSFYKALEDVLNENLGALVKEHPDVRRSISKIIERDFVFCINGENDLNECERDLYRRQIVKFRNQGLFEAEQFSRLYRLCLWFVSIGAYQLVPIFKVLQRIRNCYKS